MAASTPESDYLENRLDAQQEYHSSKANIYKKRYEGTQSIIIVTTALISILAPFAKHSLISVIITCIAALQLTLSGINRLKKYHELWVEYRCISEALKREKYLYLTRTSPYDLKTPLNLLVERVEAILQNSELNWTAIAGKKEDPAQSLGSDS